jgi:hypothetical protein
MESGLLLPARVCALPGEALSSWVRRSAAAMGYDNVNLLTRLLGPTLKAHQDLNQVLPGPHLDHLATLLGRPPTEFLPYTVHHFAPMLALQPPGTPAAATCDPATARRFFEAQTRSVCPRCLAEDVEPYERLLWTFRPLRVCTAHRCLLRSRCPTCGASLARARQHLLRCTCGASLPDIPVASISEQASACARLLEAWLQPGAPACMGLCGPPLFWWVYRLAEATTCTPAWAGLAAARFQVDVASAASMVCWTAAVDVLRGWPEEFFRFLDAYQQVPRYQRLSTGLGRSFGRMLRDAAHLEGLGYPAPAEALRRYLLERFQSGHPAL